MKTTNRTVNTEIEDTIFDTVRRLNSVHAQPPLPLRSYLADRPRDGPGGCPGPFRGPKHVTGPSGASQAILRFDYHSKGLKP